MPRCDTGCMQIFPDTLSSRHEGKRIIITADGAGWHKSSSLKVPANIRIVFLPHYSPELNPAEHVWDELKEKGFCNRVFSDIDSLEDHLVDELFKLENSPEITRSITS
jgi:transposase